MSGRALDDGREFLKDSIRLEVDFSQTDQARGLPPPPAEKPRPPGAFRISLPPPGRWPHVQPIPLVDAIAGRESRRRFANAPLWLDELAFLLWATQGVRRRVSSAVVLRTVPSAGARHPFETYVAALNVDGLPPGLWRYLPIEHELVEVRREPAARLAGELARATLGQAFTGRAAAVVVWTVLPARTEWRYGAASHKVIALDAGHVVQNLYLACEAVGAATCAIAAYDQTAMDRLVEVDGREEFVIYLAPVGRRAN